jgi:hypothetical protein
MVSKFENIYLKHYDSVPDLAVGWDTYQLYYYERRTKDLAIK